MIVRAKSGSVVISASWTLGCVCISSYNADRSNRFRPGLTLETI